MEKEKILNSFSAWKMMKRLSIDLENNARYSITEICEKTKLDNHNPIFNSLIKLLITEKIIQIENKIGRTYVIKIDIKKLNNLIENCAIWKEFAEYVHNNKIIYADI